MVDDCKRYTPEQAMEKYNLTMDEANALLQENGYISAVAAAKYTKLRDSRELQLYTVSETAKLLGCSYRHANYLVFSGQIKAVKLGGRWKVSYNALQEFIDSLETNQPVGNEPGQDPAGAN